MVSRLLRVTRKSPVLKAPAIGCLKHAPGINVTAGCAHGCIYCYARGFMNAPPDGEIHLYENLPEMLERELTRKRRLPRWVSFSSASDAFQPIDEVLDITHKSMALLLSHGIGISFLTKGIVPDMFVDLFCRNKSLIKARIGIVSVNPDYGTMFEPHAAATRHRLRLARRLCSAGVDTVVRMDPLIPGITDSEESLDRTLKRVANAGIESISVSALTLRPALMKQIRNGLPYDVYRAIVERYQGQPFRKVITSASTRLLPRAVRIEQYRRVKEIAHRYGINCSVCGCKNPDLPFEPCHPLPVPSLPRQPVLFAENTEG